jgi:hypothetical protein
MRLYIKERIKNSEIKEKAYISNLSSRQVLEPVHNKSLNDFSIKNDVKRLEKQEK